MYQYKAKLLNVVDGDTIDMAIDLGFYVVMKHRLRLYGINTPELNSSDPVERDLANKATIFVFNTLKYGETYVIDTYKDDKYGRLLAVIWVKDVSLNQMLLDNGLAKEYMK